jgi:4-amino-4-deoxychorismate lyase
VAQEPVQVEPSLEALAVARKQGLLAAGYFAFELGYALESRLTGAMPGKRHLARLVRSAHELGLGFDDAAARSALEDAVANAAGPLRVRLQLNEDGSFMAKAVLFVPPPPDTVWTYQISPSRLQSADALARHRTSWRARYDEERAAANQRGCDELIYLNERGEVVEASTTNIFVLSGGRLLTPADACGPLDGCLRRALHEAGQCAQAVLWVADLEAREVFLGNSLRGLIRAVPVTD